MVKHPSTTATNRLPTIRFDEEENIASSSLDDTSTVISDSQLTAASKIHTQQPTRCNYLYNK